MPDNTPPPPPGFTLDKPGSVPPPPPGFTIDSNEAARKQQEQKSAAQGRLGPTASGFLRAPMEVAADFATMIPDALAQNRDIALPPEKRGELPSRTAQRLIDRVTTKPTERGAQGIETGARIAGDVLMPGPKVARTPKASADVMRLASEDVIMTPGTRGGRLAQAFEEKASKILPQVQAARERAMKAWNASKLNQLLKAAGAAPVPKGMEGRDALRHAQQEMSRRYGEVIGTTTGDLYAGGKDSLHAALSSMREMAGKATDLTEQAKSTIGTYIDKVINAFTPKVPSRTLFAEWEMPNIENTPNRGGRASGESMQQIVEELRTAAAPFRRAGTESERKIADALDTMRAHVIDMLKRENPEFAQVFNAVRASYAKLQTAKKASGYSTTKEGVYTPGQKLQAIKARDTSKDKSAFNEGRAPEQKEAEGAQRVLGNKQPDSGTPQGLAVLDMLKGGSSLWKMLPSLLGAGAAYSEPVLKALQKRALRTSGTDRRIGAVAGVHGLDTLSQVQSPE